jgi:hypothetical protein
VVKTRIQIDPALKGNSLLSGGRAIVAKEGTRGLLTGFAPTAVGYLFQGGGKFMGYEFFVGDLRESLGEGLQRADLRKMSRKSNLWSWPGRKKPPWQIERLFTSEVLL